MKLKNRLGLFARSFVCLALFVPFQNCDSLGKSWEVNSGPSSALNTTAPQAAPEQVQKNTILIESANLKNGVLTVRGSGLNLVTALSLRAQAESLELGIASKAESVLTATLPKGLNLIARSAVQLLFSTAHAASVETKNLTIELSDIDGNLLVGKSNGKAYSRYIGTGNMSGAMVTGTSGGAYMELESKVASPYDDLIHFITHSGGSSHARRMTIAGNGNVGIGTVNPTSKLQITSPYSVGYKGGITFGNGGSGIYERNDKLLALQTSGVDRIRMMPNGKVSIGGDTESDAKLYSQVTFGPTQNSKFFDHGDFGFHGVDEVYAVFGANNSGVQSYIGANAAGATLGANSDSPINFQWGDGTNTFPYTKIYIYGQQGGNVGIGTTNPSYRLDVAGQIRGFGITDSSDERLKDEIRPLEGDFEKILKLSGVSYFWKNSEQGGSGRQIGVIAQQVKKFYPELVAEDKQGMMSVNYSHLVAPIIEAFKTLAARSEDSSKSILKLQQENAMLKKYLCEKDPRAPFCKD